MWSLIWYLISMDKNSNTLCRLCKNLEIILDEDAIYYYCSFFNDFIDDLNKIECEGFEELPLKI